MKEVNVQQRFEESLRGGSLMRIRSALFISGDGGLYQIGVVRGSGQAQLALPQVPYDAERWRAEIVQRVVSAGYAL